MTVAVTATSLWFGGHSVSGVTLQLTVGGVLSILMVTDAVPDRNTPFVAVHCKVVPFVSFESVTGPQLLDEIPDSGSDTFQFTVTALVYHPLLP